MGRTLREVYDAIVSDRDDPEKRGRLKVTCREIAEADTELPEWVEPCHAFAGVAGTSGFFFLPAVGDTVEIERAVGHTDDDAAGMAAIINPDTRWRCATYATAEDVPEEFTSGTYGARMGIKTASGNVLIFDDTQSAIFLVSSLIKIGSEDAASPLALGDILKACLVDFVDAVLGHDHNHPQGPTTGIIVTAPLDAIKTTYLDNDAILSPKVTTE